MKPLVAPTQLKLKNILYATDLSFAAEKALPFALEIALRYGARMYAVHAIQPDVYPLVPPPAWPKMAEQEEVFRQESRRDLERLLQAVPHEIIFRPGKVWEILSEVIREKQIDLIVMSTHGRTGFDKVLFGSVAEEIFRKAKCPVLTAGPGVSSKPKENAEMKNILYATDFSPESLAGAPYAISFAQEHGAQLILLHCPESDGDVSTLRHALRDVVPFGSELRCEPECIVEHGTPANKILEVSERHGADMIILGVHGAEGHLAGSTHLARSGAYKVVTQAKCPVLTVRG
jgi:nucleotide-binding universal stress UspA family protein